MRKVKFTKENILISLILILSAILNLANLGIEGQGNAYYAAGVKSMMMNFKNFFFVAYDPSGFVTIDKPPLGFWIQTISAKIFGFNGWSIILPQALAGVISVWLIYYLVKRTFGNIAALIAALCLAVTPIFVAASRNNTIDNILVLFLILACLAVSIAAEKGKLKYLIISVIFVGIGFNVKMLEAYMVLPAIYITYILSSILPFKERIKHLMVATVFLVLVSLSWALIVDSVPAKNRPFVGSSTNNTVMELIVGHNGLERIGIKGNLINNKTKKNISLLENNELGRKDINAKLEYNNRNNISQINSTGNINNSNKKEKWNTEDKKPNMLNTGMGNGSKASIIRLFANNNMSDQISWLLPFAFIGLLASAIKENLRSPFNNKRKLALILWGMWLIPECIYFSFTKGSFHTYYMTTMAPSIAALVGIGLSSMWDSYKEREKKAFMLPMAFIINGLVQILILSYNYKKSSYKTLILIIAILCMVPSIVLIFRNFIKNKTSLQKTSLNKMLISIAFIGILVTPTVWSFTPMFYKMNSSSPSAGLELAASGQKINQQKLNKAEEDKQKLNKEKQNKDNINMNMNNNINASNDKLIDFLKKNKENEKYIVAVPSAMTNASDIIIKTGEPVMAIGGFSGSDKIINLDKFKKIVADGELRYVMVNGTFKGGNQRKSSNSDIMQWVEENGKVVPENQWSNSKSSANKNNSMKLYDLKQVGV